MFPLFQKGESFARKLPFFLKRGIYARKLSIKSTSLHYIMVTNCSPPFVEGGPGGGSIYETVSNLLFSFREDLHLPFRIFAFV